MTLLLFSGAWGKLIHDKNLKQKPRYTVPLRYPQSDIVPIIAAGVIDTGDNLPPVSICHQCINNTLMLGSWAFGKMIHKKPEAETLMTLSL
jgi:hypothetical protein